TYRLPQPDGEIKEFNRFTNTTSSRHENQWYYATFRAIYNSDNIQASSQIEGRIDNNPHKDQSGSVTYSANAFPASNYSSALRERSKNISYKGQYFFSLPKSNSITFSPTLGYSHTNQNSYYFEDGFNAIYNGATDNTGRIRGDLRYNHNFAKAGNINGFIRGIYISNHTDYSGSAIASDRAVTSRVGAGISYSVVLGNFYGATGFGWDWDRFKFGKMVDRQSYPWYDLSLQYTLKQKHSFSTVFHYSNWPPSPNLKSDIIVQSSPFMRYTGNPNLTPHVSYDFSFDYTWIPNNNYSFSAYGWGWAVDKRYAYDYEATPTGILRTIKQPIGSFIQGKYGVTWTMRFFDRSLIFSGNLSQILNHNGKPYDANHSAIDWYARLRYYINNWAFTLTYSSPTESSEDSMNGKWIRNRSFWYVTIGWSNDKWNIRGDLFNLTRWDWKDQSISMKSPYYSTSEVLINGNSRAFIQLSATYTFGFGKKVKRDNEPTVSNSTSSGILK
ncbi:MAG: outer membrane beta-barrel family protein, partial [Muribaculaceae bacterium]|nr:outer membrane beta-barrel family protein [Muribaculaceae bacterium]